MLAPSLPSLASSTSYPAPRSIIASVVRMLRWSSTTRIFAMATLTFPRTAGCASSTQLLGQIDRVTELIHEPDLGLEPIDVLLLGDQDLGEERLGRVVPLLAAERDPLVQPLHRDVLELHVAL